MRKRPADERAFGPASRKKALKALARLAVVLAIACGGTSVAALAVVGHGKASLDAAATSASIGAGGDASTDGQSLIEYEGSRYVPNPRMVTVCVLGIDRDRSSNEDDGAGQADVVVLVAADLDTGKIKAISIPRESMVDVDMLHPDGSYSKTTTMALCLSYAFGDGGRASCENTVKSVSRALMGVPVPYYLALDLGGIAPLNDAVGGIELTAMETIPESGIEEGRPLVLRGSDARSYVQWRDESALESPLQRQARQSQYIEAFLAQAPEQVRSDPRRALALYDAVSQHAVTNLGLGEMACLAELAASGESSFDLITLEGTMRNGESYGEFHLDPASVYEAVLETYYHRAD